MDKRLKDVARNMEYGSQIGCKDADVVPDEKDGGEGGGKKCDHKLCKYRDYG